MRLIIYHTIVPVFSVLNAVIYMSLDSLGSSRLNTCFIQDHSIGETISIGINSVILALILISYCFIKNLLGCCYGPVFHHLSKVVLVVSISGILCRVLEISHFFFRDSFPITVIGSIANLVWGVSIAVTRLLHPKVIATVKEKFGIQRPAKEKLIDDNTEKEDVMKTIVDMTFEKISDDFAEMFEHLGHKILVQILVLLTLRFREESDREMSIDEALNNHQGTKERKHYGEDYYLELSKITRLSFVHQVYCPDVSLEEYEKETFRCIRRSAGFTREDMIEYYLHRSLLNYDNLRSLTDLSNEGGKSNAFFYSSTNEKIVIKTITCDDRSNFLKFLPAYSRRVFENPESKLVRILGLFKVLPHKQDFIIMENAIPYKKNCVLFDLKGSTVDRHVPKIDSVDPPLGVVLKDLNFKRYGERVRVENKERVVEGIIADMKLLKNNKLMDYSMLLGICQQGRIETRYSVGEGYSIAIIDFFGRYGIRKCTERLWKRYVLRKNKGVSSISSERYYKRIKNYLRTIVVEGLEGVDG